MVKILKILYIISSTKKASRLNLGIKHRGLKVHQVFLNDDTMMTFIWYGQICVPVAVAILEECCMAFANIQ